MPKDGKEDQYPKNWKKTKADGTKNGNSERYEQPLNGLVYQLAKKSSTAS